MIKLSTFLSAALFSAGICSAEPLLLPAPEETVFAALPAPVDAIEPATSTAPIAETDVVAVKPTTMLTNRREFELLPVPPTKPITLRGSTPRRAAGLARTRVGLISAGERQSRPRLAVTNVAYAQRFARNCDTLMCPGFVLMGVGF